MLALARSLAEPLSLARALSLVERGGPAAEELIRAVFPRTGGARVIGITGPPGAGKSTLVDQLARARRARGEKVAVLAVDPSSPFSHGAILGDRIRMGAHAEDAGVFIRSLASRGELGGLAAAVADAALVLDAAGWPTILVETVGVGQDEIAIAEVADVVVVVLTPDAGDAVQTMKAGVLEIGDLFVINKAEAGAEPRRRELRAWLALAPRQDGWEPPVLATVATAGGGVADLDQAMLRYEAFLAADARLERRREEQFRRRVTALARERLVAAALGSARIRRDLAAVAAACARRETDPYAAAAFLLRPPRRNRPGKNRF